MGRDGRTVHAVTRVAPGDRIANRMNVPAEESPWSRRRFLHCSSLLASAAVGAPTGLLARMASPETQTPTRIADLEFDLNDIYKWDDSNGDTWDPFWADDGRLYSFNCDGRGFGRIGKNLAFNRFDGTALRSLKGTQINRMAEYGPGGQRGQDNATWKACGQECIDGVFYAFVSRNVYGDESQDPKMRQTAFNSSLIQSRDHGQTWRRDAEENYRKPMWPGPSFGAPMFVHYGKNGGAVSEDRASEFVYAVSTNGFWNGGDSLVLGRVARKALSRLDAGDWEYFAGGDGNTAGAWKRSLDQAAPILELPAKLGQTPVTYVPSLGIYLLISWYITAPMTKWFEPAGMRYDFYQAEHPWGPWSLIRSLSDSFLPQGSHMYGPALCTKYQERHGSDVRLVMFTSGCQFEDKPTGIYKCWTIPVILHTKPTPPSDLVPAASTALKFEGQWTSGPDDTRMSTKVGDSATLLFTGTAVECVAHKEDDFGSIDVYLDRERPKRVALALKNFPALSGVVVFRSPELAKGQHMLKIVNAGGGPVNIQSFRVYRAGSNL